MVSLLDGDSNADRMSFLERLREVATPNHYLIFGYTLKPIRTRTRRSMGGYRICGTTDNINCAQKGFRAIAAAEKRNCFPEVVIASVPSVGPPIFQV